MPQLTGLAAIPAQPLASPRCRRCAAAAPSGLARVHGVWSVIDGRPIWECETCARAHLFEIETGIPEGELCAPAHRASERPAGVETQPPGVPVSRR
jgi:hypothetical protein